MKAIAKLKFWGLSLLLAALAAFFGINRLKAKRARKRYEVASLRVQVEQKRYEEAKTVDASTRIEVAEARRNLEAHAAHAGARLDTLYSRIDDRETRIENLRARIDAVTAARSTGG